jgi:hypothetical protein
MDELAQELVESVGSRGKTRLCLVVATAPPRREEAVCSLCGVGGLVLRGTHSAIQLLNRVQ